MLRVCTSVCLAAGVTTTAAAFAEPQTVPMTGGGKHAIRDVTVSGCVAPASDSNVYILNVIDDRTNPATPSGGAIAAGTPLRLVGLPPEDFQDYVGQQVEVFGMIMSHGSSKGRGAPVAVSQAKLGVRYIRQLAATCSAPVAAAVPMAPGKNTIVASNSGPGKSRGSRDSAARPSAVPANVLATPGATTPTTTTTSKPSTTTTPKTTTTPSTTPAASAQPVNNTAPAPGFIGTPPSNSTTANAGLGQSGVSGSATLGGAFSMSTPTIMFPIGQPAPGSTQSPLPVSTQPPAPGSTQSSVPGATPSPIPGSTSTLPGTSTLPAGFAQGASNTTNTNAALDQFGLSGDALLSGLVNVNVQQLLASVQVQANLNVQDVIVNLSDILNDNQIQALVQALNTNPQAALNANDLTSALQSSGVLNPSEWVVGVTGSQIYANKSLTDALQSRGIIQPTETIMSTATPHVFVVGPGGGQ